MKLPELPVIYIKNDTYVFVGPPPAWISSVHFGDSLLAVSYFNYDLLIKKIEQNIAVIASCIEADIPNGNSFLLLDILTTWMLECTKFPYIICYMVRNIVDECLKYFDNVERMLISRDDEELLKMLIKEQAGILAITNKLIEILADNDNSDEWFYKNMNKLTSAQNIQCRIMLLDGNYEFVYQVPDLLALIVFDFIEAKNNGRSIKVCKNCGKYFSPTVRSDEIYCSNIFRSGKTCKELGYENKVNGNEFLKAYRTIYKTQNARKQRNINNVKDIEKRFVAWADFAKTQLERCQSDNLGIEEFKSIISDTEWLKGDVVYVNH